MRCLSFLTVILVISFSTPAVTYVLEGFKWPEASTEFHVDIPGLGGLWDDAFETAMLRWNEPTNFEFQIVRNSFKDPCDDPNNIAARNGVKFSDTVCGLAWSGQAIAITITWATNDTNEIVQTGILFNTDEDWDVYSGPWWRDPYFGINDLRRIAVHELGHGLGLGHEDAAEAIMQSTAGDLEYPTADDIAGVNFLYPVAENNNGGNGGGGGGLCFIAAISGD
jgi:hypothetical protein